MSRVLLYSGGLDSLCTAWLWKYDVLLRIPTNTLYDAAEEAACQRLASMHGRWEPVVTLSHVFDFSTLERPEDAIVPNRNAYLVLAASAYGNDIHLAAVMGDRSNDKDGTFCRRMEQLLDHTMGMQHWLPRGRGNFTVQLPPQEGNLHKSALLQRALDAHMPQEALYISHSCYLPPEGLGSVTGPRTYGCGTCKPCVRKYVAMVTCGVSLPFFLFKQLPHRDNTPWLQEALDACSQGVWRCPGEDADFLAVFG
jgi:7-cyano-7-deazaguanine synthase in queuosine biosynthesis